MDGVTPERSGLAKALAETGSPLDVDAVDALIAGVLAAPPEIGASWHALVAEPTPPALADALEARRAALAAATMTASSPRISSACRAPGG